MSANRSIGLHLARYEARICIDSKIIARFQFVAKSFSDAIRKSARIDRYFPCNHSMMLFPLAEPCNEDFIYDS